MERLALLSLGLLVASCVSPAEPTPISMRAAWLTPSGQLPDEVVELSISVLEDGVETDSNTVSVAGLSDLDGDGSPELLQRNLPYHVTIEIEVRGLIAGGLTGYLGRVGPLMLEPGQRRHVDLAMYPLGVS
ncbi:MAG: hypothetical protein OEY14_18550, partial [Myxococcales bacterium]|nr:hypothetical protein [Myxococcales bacterium]